MPQRTFKRKKVKKEAMTIVKLLGMGCYKTRVTEANIKKAASELNIPIFLEKIEDIDELLKYDILSTPSVVIDGKVWIKGRVADIEEIKTLLSQSLEALEELKD